MQWRKLARKKEGSTRNRFAEGGRSCLFSAQLRESILRMKPKISAFPKCYLEQIAGARVMSVFEWIEMAKALDADGLEMYEGFFTSLDDAYIDSVGEAIGAA